jgi:adenylate kinase
MQEISPVIYVLLGCPGSGKGTFAQTIKSEGYDHVSTGDITREEVKNETDFGIKYKDAILNHIIGGIPFEEIQKLVEQRLEKAVKEQRGIILDGYPKTVQQCKFLDAFIKKKELTERMVVVLLDINEEVAIDRILYRQTCEQCNKVYNSKFSPPKKTDECDECHGVVAKRIDANSEVTKQRVYEFKSKKGAVIDYYDHSNRLNRIDGNFSPKISSDKFLEFHASQKVIWV